MPALWQSSKPLDGAPPLTAEPKNVIMPCAAGLLITRRARLLEAIQAQAQMPTQTPSLGHRQPPHIRLQLTHPQQPQGLPIPGRL